jgi:hypothetical protein
LLGETTSQLPNLERASGPWPKRSANQTSDTASSTRNANYNISRSALLTIASPTPSTKRSLRLTSKESSSDHTASQQISSTQLSRSTWRLKRCSDSITSSAWRASATSSATSTKVMN